MASIDQRTLAERATRVIPGGVNSGQRRIDGLEGLVIAATSGSTFTDGEGKVYTDYHSAFGPPLSSARARGASVFLGSTETHIMRASHPKPLLSNHRHAGRGRC